MTEMSNLAEKILKVRKAQSASFTELVAIAGLDRARAFRFANLAGVDLSNQDLVGFDFTGADLRGAKLDGAKLEGAIVRDAAFDDASSPLPSFPNPLDDLASFSLLRLTKLLRSLEFGEAHQTYAAIEKANRTHPRLLAELIMRSPSEVSGLGALREFFQLSWNGPRAYPIIRGLVANGWFTNSVLEAIEITGYGPANSSQVSALIKYSADFDVANFLYNRFVRFCSADQLAALGSFVRSPADYEHLHELAARFSSGKDQMLLALRALPSAPMIKSALLTYVDPLMANDSTIQVILAGKASSAEEALVLLDNAGDNDRLRLRILAAAIDQLHAAEAFKLFRTYTLAAPSKAKVTDCLVALYLKRTDQKWRLSVFKEFLQWQLYPRDLNAARTRKRLKFPDRVEITCLFTAVVGVDLKHELLPFASSDREYELLACGIRAVESAASDGAVAILGAVRSEYSAFRRRRAARARMALSF